MENIIFFAVITKFVQHNFNFTFHNIYLFTVKVDIEIENLKTQKK